jgi:hypothetical protein
MTSKRSNVTQDVTSRRLSPLQLAGSMVSIVVALMIRLLVKQRRLIKKEI